MHNTCHLYHIFATCILVYINFFNCCCLMFIQDEEEIDNTIEAEFKKGKTGAKKLGGNDSLKF